MRIALRLLLVILLLAAAAAGGLRWWLAQPLPLPASPYSFEVRTGASLRAVARELVDAGVLPNSLAFTTLARLRGIDRSIKAGNYEITTGTSLPQLLDKLTQGDVTEFALTIIEGSSFAALRASLAANAEVNKTVLDLSDADLMRRLGAESASPEGWFFPDTYFYSGGASDLALLTRAYKLMRARLNAAWQDRAANLPLNDPYEALILASLVEKETGNSADRPLIASVFVNRLRLGMRLQSDPSVVYGLGADYSGRLSKRDLDSDSPWNTYVHAGLPPTPIALPGQAALDAVLHPPPTAYLYFVARGDGNSEFSTNLADHNRAVAKYQRGHAGGL